MDHTVNPGHVPRTGRRWRLAAAALGWVTILAGWPVLAVATHWGLPAPADWYRRLLTGGFGESRILLHTLTMAGWLLWIWLVRELALTIRHARRVHAAMHRWRPLARRHYTAAAIATGTVLLADTVLRVGTAAVAQPAPATQTTTENTPPRTPQPPTADEDSGDVTAGVLTSASVAPLVSTFAPAHPPAAPAAPLQKPQAVIPVSALARYDRVTAAADRAHPTGTVTLVVGGCGYTYEVFKGDSLWRIAKECLGDPERWSEIWKLNKGKHWPRVSGRTTLHDPDLIFPGWVLTLPADATVPQGAKPVDPPVTKPGVASPPVTEQPSSPITRPPTPPQSPSTQQVVPSTSTSTTAIPRGRDDSADGPYAPPSAPTGTPSLTAPPSARTSLAGNVKPPMSASASLAAGSDESASASSPTGVDLPGGWITLGLGAGLLAAVAMVWRRRRHRYQPTPVTAPRLDDPDLLPPLAAMTRIRTSVRRAVPESLDDEPAAAPTVREYRQAAVKPDLPPVGPSGAELAGAATLPLSTGLGLTGDGALDAARGLLVAALAAGNDDDPHAKGRAIIPAATLATLLGVCAVDLGHIERLTVAASVPDAITTVEEEIIRRSRLIADAQAAQVRTLREDPMHAEPLPQLLLISELPDPVWSNRLVTAVRLGHSVDIGAAMIGDWPTGTTLTVAADGTTGAADTPRLAVVGTSAAIEMLGLLREAHGDRDGPAPAKPQLIAPPVPAASAPAASTTDVDHAPDGEAQHDDERSDDAYDPPAPAATGQLPVTIRILGRPAIIGPDGEPMKGLRKASVELMVLLAVNRNGLKLIDIMDALYPHANMRRASERLSTTAADLRKHIRKAAAGAGTSEQTPKPTLEPIPNTGSHYHLDPAIVTVDWWTVLDEYEAAATATDDTQRLTHLIAAINAASGPLADGVDYDWIDTDRELVRRHRIKLHAHAAALLADRDPHQSWLLLEQACQIDPLSDELARATMRAAAVLGDADAIRHRLTALREALEGNGLELADETDDLAKELLRQLHPPRQPE